MLLSVEKIASLKPVHDQQETLKNEEYSIKTLQIPHEYYVEKAGLRIGDFALEVLQKENINAPLIMALVGKGHNGSDGLAGLKHIVSQKKIPFWVVSPYLPNELSTFSQKTLDVLAAHAHNVGIKHQLLLGDKVQSVVKELQSVKHEGILQIDGLLGAGLKGEMKQDLFDWVNIIQAKLNKTRQLLSLAIDVPSGLSFEAKKVVKVVKANYTITFEAPKKVHLSQPTKALCGEVKVAHIGLFSQETSNTFLVDEQNLAKELLPKGKDNSYKSLFGNIVVAAGDKEMAGAGVLAATSALKSGCGLVTLTPLGDYDSLPFKIPPEIMIKPYLKKTSNFLKKADALVLGPGLGQTTHLQEKALKLLQEAAQYCKYIVLDADGLSLILQKGLDLASAHIILTPHPKEAGDLISMSSKEVSEDRFLAISRLLKLKVPTKGEVVWILKGADTLVSHQEKTFIFSKDLPLLATAGSGDVLSGLVASLCVQCQGALKGSLLAMSLQHEAAKVLSKKASRGFLASEILPSIQEFLEG